MSEKKTTEWKHENGDTIKVTTSGPRNHDAGREARGHGEESGGSASGPCAVLPRGRTRAGSIREGARRHESTDLALRIWNEKNYAHMLQNALLFTEQRLNSASQNVMRWRRPTSRRRPIGRRKSSNAEAQTAHSIGPATRGRHSRSNFGSRASDDPRPRQPPVAVAPVVVQDVPAGVRVRLRQEVPAALRCEGSGRSGVHASAEQDYRSVIEREALLPDEQIAALAGDAFEQEAFTIDWSARTRRRARARTRRSCWPPSTTRPSHRT